jgi:hypothetical protein
MESLKTKPTRPKARTGIAFPRHFTAKQADGKTPYDDVQWETRTSSIGNDKGHVIFEQRDIEVPVDWSQTATNIVASKYFYGKLGSPDRETSVGQLVQRVVDTIADWGKKDGYFHTDRDTITWVATAYLLAQAAVIPITGFISVGSPTMHSLGRFGRPPRTLPGSPPIEPSACVTS